MSFVEQNIAFVKKNLFVRKIGTNIITHPNSISTNPKNK